MKNGGAHTCTNCVRRQKAGEETQGVGERVFLLIAQDVAVSVFANKREREREKAEKERKRLEFGATEFSIPYLMRASDEDH